MNRMIRYWIGTALLAGSWLLGLDYFYPANPWAWFAAVVAAVVLFGNVAKPLASSQKRTPSIVAIALLLPPLGLAPWPYRMAPLLIVVGLAIPLLSTRRRWAAWLAGGALATGVVMLVQALALELYTAQTARCHDLPQPLADLLAGVASLLGIDAAAYGSNVVMHSMRQTHRLGATWELFLDPATFLFFVGGVAMLAVRLANGRSDEDDGSVSESDATRLAAAGTVACETVGPTFRRPLNGDSAASTSDNRLAGDGDDSAPGLQASRWRLWMAGFRVLTLIVVAWLPVRAGLLMAVYLHRVLRSDPDRPLHAMNHVFSPWMLMILLVVPVMLAWRFVRVGGGGRGTGGGGQWAVGSRQSAVGSAENSRSRSANQQTEQRAEQAPPLHDAAAVPLPPSCFRLSLAVAFAALAVALLMAAVCWNPVGARRGGRVMVVERHSQWEPTTKAYDTTWFVEPKLFGEGSGYNYARIYRYLGQYYDMSRLLEKDKIDDATLAKCDVLIVKIPTTRYSPDEVAAVKRFVEQGGGLLLIGDHTNFERSSTIINDIVRPMGFVFRDDLLFSFGRSAYEQSYAPAVAPHPAVQYVPSLDFDVSCSIDPGDSHGRPVITSTGLWSMGPEYHHENYHPIPQHCPAMRYGAFVQAWAAWHGQGRVLAFTDSTIFSNFCVGQPGKSEVMLGMVEWLNHANPWFDPRPWLLSAGVATLAAGWWIGRGSFSNVWPVLLAAGACGWAVGSLAVIGVHRWNMPPPERLRPERCAAIDRATSTVPLSEGPYSQGGGRGFGLFEQWLARLDCHTVRQQSDAMFSADVLVAIHPTQSISERRREELERYVASGGKLLVIDSPDNINSTANGMLWPFRLSIHHQRGRLWKGKLVTALKLPKVDVAAACEVAGGQPVAWVGPHAVAAVAQHGKGSVMAIGFGSLWNDQGMGELWTKELVAEGDQALESDDESTSLWTLEPDAAGRPRPRLEKALSPGWAVEPDAVVKTRCEVLFGLLQPFFDGAAWPESPPASQQGEKIKDSGLKESGPKEL
jgi:hypothetical protein